ncbi:MAG: exonuclease SbcCD subunit D [Firmicutes bacterium]|nr:exonuclease SbcCD subunit D [Bacillota bacterium]
MRLLHTADWHLGRTLCGASLLEEQAYLLDQLADIVGQEGVEAVLLAGDVYDRAVPPPEAVRLLDDTLCRLVLGLEVPVIVVAGNHDSPERLSFGARLLAGRRLHVRGAFHPAARPVVLEDAHGPVHILPLPYLEPATAQEVLGNGDLQVLGNGDLRDHDSAVRAAAEALKAASREAATGAGSGAWPDGLFTVGPRTVLVAHAFVAGGQASESERPLSVGGAGTVEASALEGFTYVALGHLHRPQRVAGAAHMRYAGSLYAYSFTEDDHDKSVTLVELGRDGPPEVRIVPLRPRRRVRRIEGTLAGLLGEVGREGPPLPPGPSEDYLMVTLLDRGPVFDAIGRLRRVYPNVLHVARPWLGAGVVSGSSGAEAFAEAAAATAAERGSEIASGLDRRRLSDLDLLRSFFRDVVGEPPSPEEEAAYAEAATQVELREREAATAAPDERSPGGGAPPDQPDGKESPT